MSRAAGGKRFARFGSSVRVARSCPLPLVRARPGHGSSENRPTRLSMARNRDRGLTEPVTAPAELRLGAGARIDTGGNRVSSFFSIVRPGRPNVSTRA